MEATPTSMRGYYAVYVKGGHVGRNRYLRIAHGVRASSARAARQFAKGIPRTKHHSNADVLEVVSISPEEYWQLLADHQDDPYMQARTPEDIARIYPTLHGRIEYERKTSARTARRIHRGKVIVRKAAKWRRLNDLDHDWNEDM